MRVCRDLGFEQRRRLAELENGERARVGTTPERRIFTDDELAQTIAEAREPWRTLFRLATVVGARLSELLGLWWEDLELGDLDAATIRFGFQIDIFRQRVELKTQESKATLPLPRSTALMLLEHKARTPAPTSPQSFVFALRTGRPLHQRRAMYAMHRAQERARDARGLPTFPELFEVDERGQLVVGADGEFVLAKVKHAGWDCRPSTRCDTARRCPARTPRRRVTCCATRTPTSRA